MFDLLGGPTKKKTRKSVDLLSQSRPEKPPKPSAKSRTAARVAPTEPPQTATKSAPTPGPRVFDLLGAPTKKKRAAVDLLAPSRAEPAAKRKEANALRAKTPAPETIPSTRVVDLLGVPAKKKRIAVDLLGPSRPERAAKTPDKAKSSRAKAPDTELGRSARVLDLLATPAKKKRASIDLLAPSKPDREDRKAPRAETSRSKAAEAETIPGRGVLDLLGAPAKKKRVSVDLLAPSKPERKDRKPSRAKKSRTHAPEAETIPGRGVLDLLGAPAKKTRVSIDLLAPSKPERNDKKPSRAKKSRTHAPEGETIPGRGVLDLLGAPAKKKRVSVDLLAPSKPEKAGVKKTPARSATRKSRVDLPPTETILFYGQSNAGAGGRDTPDLVTPITDGTILTFATRPQSYGRERVDYDDMSGLGTLYDRAEAGPMGATAMAFALKGAPWADLPPDLAYFMFTVWYGDQPLSTFVRGTTAWANLMDSVTRAEEALSDAGRRNAVGALVFLQGENGPRERAIYGAAFNDLLDDLLPEISTRTGQPDAPICLLAQMNRGTESMNAASGVELAQWDVARSRDDTMMVGPSYHLPLVDNIHHTSAGRMMLGEMLAYAYAAHKRRGQRFLPLHPIGAEREGRRIRLRFHLPEPSSGLSWDTDWLNLCEHRGFAYTDTDRSAVIDKVEISGPDEVTLLLDKEPTGANKTVLYAQGQTARPGWASARGQLVNRTDHPSYFAAQGYKVPPMLNHYCLRSEVAVA